MKKILIILITYMTLVFSVNAELSFCDKANIDNTKETFDDICNVGNRIDDINKINTFTGDYVNIKSGYFGNTFNFKKVSKNNNINIGYFGTKNTNIVFEKIDNISLVGYWGTKYTLDNKILTKFIFPIGYLKNFEPTVKNKVIINKVSKHEYSNNIVTYKNITYYNLLKEIIIENTYNTKGGISKYEYNKLINNVLDVILNGNKDKIILGKDIILIKKQIEEGIFIKQFKKLINRTEELNSALNKTSNYKIKLYILKYYLN